MSVQVFPCQCPEGHYLTGYPREPLAVSKAEAKWLVATKAFSYNEDGLHAKEETHESATWPPPEPEAAETEDPADAGSSDSKTEE